MKCWIIVDDDAVLDACLRTSLAYTMSTENLLGVFTEVERCNMGIHFNLSGQVAGCGTVFYVPESDSSSLSARGVAAREELVRPRAPS